MERGGAVYADGPVTIDLNPRELRMYDRLRAYVVSPHAGAATGLRDLLLLLPDLVVLLFRLTRDPRVPLASKGVAAAAVAYILSPLDIVPEILFGPIALIDDLIVVGTALSRMVNQVHPDVVRMHWPGQGDALDAIQRVSNWTEAQFVGRIRGVVRRLTGGLVR